MADYSVKVNADVSNYNNNIDSAAGATKKFQDAADDANKTLNDLGQKGAKSAKDLLKEMQNLEKGGRSVSNYRQKLSRLQKDIQDLTINYRAMSKEMQNSDLGRETVLKIQELTKEAANYKDAIMDAQQSVAALASDTANWDAMKQGIGMVSGALQGVASAGILSAESTEQLVGVIAKLQAIEKTTNAVIQIGNALQKNSALMMSITRVQTAALTKATQLQTAATGKATIAQRVFNAVAKANPYVLLASVIIAVVSALAAFTIANNKAKKAEEEAQKAHEAYMESMKESISKMGEAAYTFDTLREKYLECRTEAEKQQFMKDYKSKLDDLGISVNSLNGLEDVFINKTEAFRQACILRAQAMGLEAMQADQYKETMSELMKARDLTAGRGGQRINEGDPLFDMLKKYGVGQYVSRLGKDYINAPLDIEKQLEASIRAAGKKASKAIDDEQKNLEDQVKALDLGDAFNFKDKGNSGLPETVKKTTSEVKAQKKEYTSQLEIAKKLLSTLEEQKKYIQEGTDEWKEQLKRIDAVKDKIKELEDQEKAYIASLKRAPLEKLELPTSNLNLPNQVKTPEVKIKPVLAEDRLRELYASAEKAAEIVNERFKLGLIDKEAANEMIKNINDSLKSAGIRAEVTLDINVPEVQNEIGDKLRKAVEGIDTYASIGDGIVGNFSDIYDNLTSLGEKIEEIDDPLKQFFTVWQSGMQIIDSVAGVIETIATVTDLVNAKTAAGIPIKLANAKASEKEAEASLAAAGGAAAEAVAQGAQSTASIPVIGWILAGVAAVTLLATLLSAMKSAKKFAGGGIVGGNSYSGDKILAGLNSGEMVLNKGQQANLFKMLNDGTPASGNGKEVEFKIRGTELIGVLNNINKKNSKI